MAYVKIKQVHTTVIRALEYILQPGKTDEGVLTASNCVFDSSDAKAIAEQFEWALTNTDRSAVTNGREVLAHHIIQSFKPGEVTPEDALALGVEFVERFTNGEYLYAVATHVDRGHVHNHIQLCPVNMTTGKKLRVQKHTLFDLRALSDQLCEQRGLSVLPEDSRARGRAGLGEIHARLEGRSWRDQVREIIDEATARANTFDQFVDFLRSMNVAVDLRAGYSTFRLEGMERSVRDWRLGAGYSQSEIIARLGQENVIEFTVTPKLIEKAKTGNGSVILLPNTGGELRVRVADDAIVRSSNTARVYLSETQPVTVFNARGEYVQTGAPALLYEFFSAPQARLGRDTQPAQVQGRNDRHTKFLEGQQRRLDAARGRLNRGWLEYEHGQEAPMVAGVKLRELASLQQEIVIDRDRVREAAREGKISKDALHQYELRVRDTLQDISGQRAKYEAAIPKQPNRRGQR